jgi:CPA1 family monovalent cation:H+ antiporter
MLPSVIRWLGIANDGRSEHRRQQEAELAARSQAIDAARRHLEKIAGERKLSGDVVALLNARHDHRARFIPSDLDEGLSRIHAGNDLRLELIAEERRFLYQLLRDGKIVDESRRRLERELDLEEATILAHRNETPL